MNINSKWGNSQPVQFALLFAISQHPPPPKHINKTVNFLGRQCFCQNKALQKHIQSSVPPLSVLKILGSRPLVMRGWNQALLESQIPHLSDLILLLQNKPPSHWSIAAAWDLILWQGTAAGFFSSSLQL